MAQTAAVAAWCAQAGDLELAHRDEPVVGRAVRLAAVGEIDNARARLVPFAVRVAIGDGHSVADELVKFLIVLEQRSGEVGLGEGGDGLLHSLVRELRVGAG